MDKHPTSAKSNNIHTKELSKFIIFFILLFLSKLIIFFSSSFQPFFRFFLIVIARYRINTTKYVIKEPEKPGLFYNPPCYWLINQLIQSAFSSKSSKYHKSQTRRARELKFWENVHPPQHVTCHMPHVTCHVSHVTCHVSHVTCNFFFDKPVKLIGGGSVINGANPV